MLTDIVSRGGNLLLDIGPAADGTIPVVMQDRLHQIGGLAQDQRRCHLRQQALEDFAPMERWRSAHGEVQRGV